MTMRREDFDNKLDSLIDNAIGTETSFDFDKWKRQHQSEIRKYKAKTAGQSRRRPRRTLIGFAAAVGAMAAMIAIAVILTRPDEPTEVAQYKPLPAHIATIGRLNMAFRSGGLEAIEDFCERSVRTTGPRPERMTAQQLLNEMEHETEPEKGNDNENHSHNNAFNHHTSA